MLREHAFFILYCKILVTYSIKITLLTCTINSQPNKLISRLSITEWLNSLLNILGETGKFLIKPNGLLTITLRTVRIEFLRVQKVLNTGEN